MTDEDTVQMGGRRFLEVPYRVSIQYPFASLAFGTFPVSNVINLRIISQTNKFEYT